MRKPPRSRGGGKSLCARWIRQKGASQRTLVDHEEPVLAALAAGDADKVGEGRRGHVKGAERQSRGFAGHCRGLSGC